MTNNKMISLAVIALMLAGSLLAVGTVAVDPDNTSDPSDNALGAIPSGAIPISNADDLARVGTGKTYGGYTWSLSAYYYLTTDIILSGENNWTPIGTSSAPFTGTFNGNGYTISGINRTNVSTGYFGFIGVMNNASVTRLHVVVNFTRSNAYDYRMGGIAAVALGNSVISECYVKGSIKATDGTFSTNTNAVGGIVGFTNGNASYVTIRDCYNLANLQASGSDNWFNGSRATKNAGGIAGLIENTLVINCYNIGSITTVRGGNAVNVGGIVGWTINTNCIWNCYTLNVSGVSLIGNISTTTYTDASNDGSIPPRSSAQESGVKSDQMMRPSLNDAIGNNSIYFTGTTSALNKIISGWDFADTWTIAPGVNNGYPTLLNFRYVDPKISLFTLDNMPSIIKLRPGDIIDIDILSSQFKNTFSSVPWITVTASNHAVGTAQYGTWTVSIPNSSPTKSITIDVFSEILFKIPSLSGYIDSAQISHGMIQLPNPGSNPNYTLNWYTSETGNGMIGVAGQTILTSALTPATLWGRWEQTTASVTPSTDDVYVHYLDSMAYTINATPSGSSLSAQWANSNIKQPFTLSGNKLFIDRMELVSGTYEILVTVSFAGMSSSTMSLFVHVYPHEIRDLEPYGLSPWTYSISTNNAGDTISLIRGTMTANGNVSELDIGMITVDTAAHTIGYTFTEEGIYEFTVRITSPAGDSNTVVLRMLVTNDVVSGMPAADGLSIHRNTGTNADLVLINAVNFVNVLWDYGDGNSAMSGSHAVNHTYARPGVYIVTATLFNSFGDSYQLTEVVDAMIVSMPSDAYRGSEYAAVIEVAGLNENEITVCIPDWLEWEFIAAGDKNYVRIFGVFNDVGIVGSTVTVNVSSNGDTDEQWNVLLDPASSDTPLRSDFEWELTGDGAVRIRYTGSFIGTTVISVKWTGDSEYCAYIPSGDGWMYSPSGIYSEPGNYLVTVSARTQGLDNESTSFHQITISASAVDPVPGPGPGTGGGDDDGMILAIAAALAAAVLLTVLFMLIRKKRNNANNAAGTHSDRTERYAGRVCGICFGIIRTDETTAKCACGQEFHDLCAAPTGVCPYCKALYSDLVIETPKIGMCPICGTETADGVCACNGADNKKDIITCGCGNMLAAGAHVCKKCGREHNALSGHT